MIELPCMTITDQVIAHAIALRAEIGARQQQIKIELGLIRDLKEELEQVQELSDVVGLDINSKEAKNGKREHPN